MGIELNYRGGFEAICDCCGEMYFDSEGCSSYVCVEKLEERLKNGTAGWIHENKQDKWYCEDCYYIDGDDAAITKTDPPIIVSL